MATITMTKKRTEYGRMLRFMMVGLSGTLVDFALLTFFKEVIGLATLIANSISFCGGLINNFTWNRLWTFADSQNSSLITQFLKFGSVSVIGLLLNNLIVLALEAPFGGLFGTVAYLPAKVIATGIVFLWNFSANRYWTFNTSHQEVSS
ncbi:MAG TPA: GtrA family protein [Aggregatilineales bacterium]|nr:GtrA family protein [Aggregatilineales bacterium]